MEKEDEIIDNNLRLIYESSIQLSRADFIGLNKKELSHIQNTELQLTLIDEALINDIGVDGKFIRLTSFGKRVILEYGGWIKYLDYKKNETANKIRKEELDLTISDFQVRTKNYPFIVSIIGIAISIAAIVFSVTKNNKQKEKQTKQQVLNKQLNKLFHTKKCDSIKTYLK